MRVIEGKIYRITGQLDGQVQFVECFSEEELMEHLAMNWYGLPSTVVHIARNGKTPKVAVHTNPYYKEVVKKLRQR